MSGGVDSAFAAYQAIKKGYDVTGITLKLFKDSDASIDAEKSAKYLNIKWEEVDYTKEFQDKVSWNYISIYQKLSEEFIREFQDKVSWYSISRYQKLYEEFIKEFQDEVNWYYI